ncbi:MAG: hypothetical protein LQ338_007995 [Usnochroma carphineum]|nr:MAG: hypothetical protein LQ338_007995 [Usnochroma carphineum]
MVSEYSVYAVHEAQRLKWLPGEELAATSFIAMTYLLIVEVNIEIHRVFQRRRGIYFWAMQIGSLGCFLDATAMILRYLVPGAERVWVLYTLMPTVGWATYTVAQLTVLYSRLHLVCRSPAIQRRVFYMIVIVSPILIIADWITIWPAWDPDPKVTDKWSAPAAIVERIAQIGFSIVEVTINIIYVICLIRLLRLKSNVRQRRVMLDLMYVIAIAVTFDVLNIILVYVNRTGISHPIQTFSYALKLRLEFVVLNQLMAVAARGLGQNRNTFAEKRYHYPSSIDTSTFKRSMKKPDKGGDSESLELCPSNNTTTDVQISAPSPTVLKPPATLDEDQRRHRSRPSLGGNSNWYPPHMESPLRNLLPRSTSRRKSSDEHEMVPVKVKRRRNGLRRNEEDEPEEDMIGVHEWENNGQHVLVVPWFSEDREGA